MMNNQPILRSVNDRQDGGKKSLYIYYPTTRIGGAQLLFVRMALVLNRNHGWSINVIDITNGFVSTELGKAGVEFNLHLIGGGKIYVDDGVLMIPLGYTKTHLKCLSVTDRTRVFMWSIHPHLVLSYFRFGFIYHRLPKSLRATIVGLLEARHRRRAADFMCYAESRGGLAYMDAPNLQFPETIGIKRKLSHQLLPIPIQCDGIDALQGKWIESDVSVAWLGRLDDEKWPALLASIELVGRIAKILNITISYHIIGVGEYFKAAQKLLRPGLRFIVPGRVSGAALHDYLRNGCRLGFAMGTSALEFGSLGIPTLVVDPSKRIAPLSRFRIRWLHQIEDYDLGNFVGESGVVNIGLGVIRDVIMDEGINKLYSERCRRCTMMSHDIRPVGTRLDLLLMNTELTAMAMERMLIGCPCPVGPVIKRISTRLLAACKFIIISG